MFGKITTLYENFSIGNHRSRIRQAERERIEDDDPVKQRPPQQSGDRDGQKLQRYRSERADRH